MFLRFLFLILMSSPPSVPKYFQSFLGSNSLMSFSNVFPIYILFWRIPLFKHILAHFLNQNSYSPMLSGNCPCILFLFYLSLVFSAMLTFIFLVSLSTSVSRHLAVCNTAESVLCWCNLKTCISGFPSCNKFHHSFNFYCVGCFYLHQAPSSPFSGNIQAIYICFRVMLSING